MRDSPPWPPLLAVLLVLLAGALAWPFSIDDAFIVARYAHNLVAGAGYGFNPGVPSDGVTGPLWLLPMGLGEWLFSAPMPVAKGVDLACAAAAAALVTRRASRGAWWVAVLVGTNAAFLPWSVAGLGGGLAALLLVLAAPGSRRAAGVAGLAVGLLAWLRPEACVAGVVLLLGHAPSLRRRALAVATVGVLAVIVFRGALFGHVLPMALAAKPSTPLSGLGYVLRGSVVCFGFLGLLAVAAGARSSPLGRVYAAAVGAQLAAVALAGGDWMPGFRLLAPIVPIYALACAEGFAYMRVERPRVGLALAVVTLVVPLIFSVLELPDLRAAAEARERAAEPLARELSHLGGPVALVDVGYLGYRADVDVVDLGGVTDPVVAHSPGGHLDKRVDPAYLALRDPVAILLHAATPPEVDDGGNLTRLTGYPVERRVAAMPFVRLRYRVERVVPYAPGYFYVLLLRRSEGD
jgi:hypothetical protein